MFFDNSVLSSGQLPPPKKKDEKNKIQKTLKKSGYGGEGPKW